MPAAPFRFSPARARVGISLVFFTNGAVFANLIPRYPEVKGTFGLSDGAFGLMVAAAPLGAIVASALPAPLIRRFGAPAVSLVGTVVLAAFLAAAGFAPHAAVVAMTLFGAGLFDSIVDSAQNVHGLRVEDACGRTIINSLHALWSLGAMTGGATGAWAATHGVPLGAHLTASAIAGITIAALGTWLGRLPGGGRPPLPVDGSHPPTRLPVGAWAALLPLALLAISSALVEDVGANWMPLYLIQVVGTSAGVAGLGFVVMIGAQFAGRLLGDPATDLFGRTAVTRAGGVAIAVGGLLIIAFPVLPVVLVGYALAGWGCATIIPAAYAAAGRLPGLPEGSGVTLIGWLLRLGFLVTSPLVGAVSELASLRVAFGVLIAAGVVIVALARFTTSSPD